MFENMYDFLVDMYAYRQRELKSNLENWLTESVAAVLNVLDIDQWNAIIPKIIGNIAAQSVGVPLKNTPIACTQVQAGGIYGIPDLVIYIDSKPILLFENKVAHGIGTSALDENGGGSQLHKYAEWLALQNGEYGSKPHLVFLTHITRPPLDFSLTASDPNYHGVKRHVTSWGELGRALLSITEEEGERSLAFGLASAFYRMLESENMANEFPSSTAISSLEVFLSQGGEIENLVDRMWREVAFAVNCSNRDRMKIDVEIEFGQYCAWRYTNRMATLESTSTFLSVGIWFPEVGDGWGASELERELPSGPQIFLYLGDERSDSLSRVEGKPSESWCRPEGEFLCLMPLFEFRGTPDDRASQLLKWLAGEAALLNTFLANNGLSG